MYVVLWKIFAAVLCGLIGAPAFSSDVVSFFTREKCMDELGCFNAGSPFFNFLERPISLLPDDREQINTTFMLYTPENPNIPANFSNLFLNIDELVHSGFNPRIKTKFVIPGYISNTASFWKMPLKNALLFSERSNVFFVDWTGGDGSLYEQAVANTRVVGAEIALFIQHLQTHFKIELESVHIIGHSLGSHIAGYAGKRLTNLGRITAMDPAGPYFTDVDPVVRLDRGDALLVDAIHTNAAPSRFQGFGLTESIGHFDFFPNGGHLQPGCPDMGHAILSFLTHPTFDSYGLHDIQCNHVRAIELFTSSIVNDDCELLGSLCNNWEDFVAGKCESCKKHEGVCVTLGIHADKYINFIDKNKSLNFYLNTVDHEPFCLQ